MVQNAKGVVYQNITKPLYLQLKDILTDQIESGDLLPGGAIPTERMLAQMYDISRVTVRKCIMELVQEGHLIRSQGKKTTVAQRKVDHHLGRLIGSVEEFLLNENNAVSIKVIHKGFVTGSASVRKHLQMDEAAAGQIYEFTRSIVNDGQPVAVNLSFVPYEIGKLIDSLDLSRAKVFTSLENCGYSLSYGMQEITSALCAKDESGILEYEIGQPVLVIRRTNYLENGYPILYEKTVYRSDKYQYSIRLQRKI
jgi:GntR family transcriptional regulator